MGAALLSGDVSYLDPAEVLASRIMFSGIRVGSVVMLKSGGPLMVVNSTRDRTLGIIGCEWFDGNVLIRDAFDFDSLIIKTQ